MEEDLKPCPFCGRRVEIKTVDRGYYTPTRTPSWMLRIDCLECDVHFVEHAMAWNCNQGNHSIRAEAEAKLRMRWNTRHGSDQQTIAELESMNARLAFPHIKMGVDGQAYIHHGEPTEYRAHFSVTEDALASVPLKVFEREIRDQTEKIIRQMLAKAAEIQSKTKAGEES